MKQHENYIPRPIDTSDVVLPEELTALAAEIARNVHEVWAESRIAEGWTYGPERNDSLKQTPCMVDFDDLPDSEKAYDLDTAFSTLRLISKLGFRIVPPEKE